MKKMAGILLSVLHLIVASMLLVAGQYIAYFLTKPLGGIPVLRSIANSVAYLISTIALTVLYAKLATKTSTTEMGLVNRLPEGKWFLTGLLLPLMVTVFYLIFGNGEIRQNPSFDVAGVLSAVTLSGGIAGFVEEVVFRGMLMRAIQKKLGTVVAVLAPSVLFAAIHTIMIPDLSFLNVALLIVGGTLVAIMFSLIALYSGNIWSGSVVHAIWNMVIIGGIFAIQIPGYGVVENYLYEYTLNISNPIVSGGAYGIECGLPSNIGFLLISLWILFMIKKEKEQRHEESVFAKYQYDEGKKPN